MIQISAEDFSRYIAEKRNEEFAYTICPGNKKLTFTFNNQYKVYKRDKIVYDGQSLTEATEIYNNN